MPIIKQNRHINKLNKPNKNKIGKGGDFMSTYKAGRPSKYNPTTKKGVEPAKCAGEYRIRNAEGALTYIGETNNLYDTAHDGAEFLPWRFCVYQ